MATAISIQPYTFADFCRLVKDDQKADLIDGVIYMASPDNTDANELFMWLGTLMLLFAQRYRLGKVYGTRVAYWLDETNSPEPDIGFVVKARLGLVRRGHVHGPPDLAVEIVSPDSTDRDYLKKRRQYQRFGVREYWIIDELKKKVILLRLGANGRYRQVKPRKGELHSEVLTWFWLRPEWLWQSPLPDTLEIFQEMVAKTGGKN